MKFNLLTIAVFLSGLVSGVAQLAYWFRWPVWMSDASLTTPAFYVIFFPFVFWIGGVVVSFNKFGRGAVWTLFPAVIAWIAPAIILSLFFWYP